MRSGAGAEADIRPEAIAAAVAGITRVAIARNVVITRAVIMSVTVIIIVTALTLAVTTATGLMPTGTTPVTIIGIIAAIGITAIGATTITTTRVISAARCRIGTGVGGAAVGTLMASARVGACSPAVCLSGSACRKLFDMRHGRTARCRLIA